MLPSYRPCRCAFAPKTESLRLRYLVITPYRCAFAPKTESGGLRYLVITPYRCAFAPKTESICRKLGLQNRKAGRGGENERVGGGAGLKAVTTLSMLALRTPLTPLNPLTPY